MPKKKNIFVPGEAFKKAEAYCAYQERCQQEVRNKLYEWGLKSTEVEQIISDLITANFLNEERFAKVYAGGKFRIKKWGKNRIFLELKKRNISDYCIHQAMKELDENYLQTLRTILAKKKRELQEEDPQKKQHKMIKYAISKGFEPELVWSQVKNDKSFGD